jgi:hypothetical protein
MPASTKDNTTITSDDLLLARYEQGLIVVDKGGKLDHIETVGAEAWKRGAEMAKRLWAILADRKVTKTGENYSAVRNLHYASLLFATFESEIDSARALSLAEKLSGTHSVDLQKHIEAGDLVSIDEMYDAIVAESDRKAPSDVYDKASKAFDKSVADLFSVNSSPQELIRKFERALQKHGASLYASK